MMSKYDKEEVELPERIIKKRQQEEDAFNETVRIIEQIKKKYNE